MDEYELKKYYIPMNLQYFADGAADKTEEPTAKKVSDARNEGQVAKSTELVNGAMLFVFFLAIKLFSGYLANSFIKTFHKNYTYISVYSVQKPEIGNVSAMFRSALSDILLMLLPIFAFAVVVAFA